MFSEALNRQQKIRGIKNGEFGIGPQTLQSIKAGRIVPVKSDLDLILATFKQVAEEQGADPEIDRAFLTEAWWLDTLTKDGAASEFLRPLAHLLTIWGSDPDKRRQAVNELLSEAAKSIHADEDANVS